MQDRGIKLFEVMHLAWNRQAVARAHDHLPSLKRDPLLQIFSKEARVERRRKLKVHKL